MKEDVLKLTTEAYEEKSTKTIFLNFYIKMIVFSAVVTTLTTFIGINFITLMSSILTLLVTVSFYFSIAKYFEEGEVMSLKKSIETAFTGKGVMGGLGTLLISTTYTSIIVLLFSILSLITTNLEPLFIPILIFSIIVSMYVYVNLITFPFILSRDNTGKTMPSVRKSFVKTYKMTFFIYVSTIKKLYKQILVYIAVIGAIMYFLFTAFDYDTIVYGEATIGALNSSMLFVFVLIPAIALISLWLLYYLNPYFYGLVYYSSLDEEELKQELALDQDHDSTENSLIKNDENAQNETDDVDK